MRWHFIPCRHHPAHAVRNPTPPGATLQSLEQITLVFSEPVSGVDKEDLLMNGVPASRVSGSLSGPYVFEFTPPADGRS